MAMTLVGYGGNQSLEFSQIVNECATVRYSKRTRASAYSGGFVDR